MKEITGQYGYAPKSKLIYQRGMDGKSTTSSKRSRPLNVVGPYNEN